MFQNITGGIATAAGRVSIWAVVYRAQLGPTLCVKHQLAAQGCR